MQLTYDKNGQMKLVLNQLSDDVLGCMDWSTENERAQQASRTHLRLMAANAKIRRQSQNPLVELWSELQQVAYQSRYLLGMERLSDADKRARRQVFLTAVGAMVFLLFAGIALHTSAIGNSQKPMEIKAVKLAIPQAKRAVVEQSNSAHALPAAATKMAPAASATETQIGAYSFEVEE